MQFLHEFNIRIVEVSGDTQTGRVEIFNAVNLHVELLAVETPLDARHRRCTFIPCPLADKPFYTVDGSDARHERVDVETVGGVTLYADNHRTPHKIRLFLRLGMVQEVKYGLALPYRFRHVAPELLRLRIVRDKCHYMLEVRNSLSFHAKPHTCISVATPPVGVILALLCRLGKNFKSPAVKGVGILYVLNISGTYHSCKVRQRTGKQPHHLVRTFSVGKSVNHLNDVGLKILVAHLLDFSE